MNCLIYENIIRELGKNQSMQLINDMLVYFSRSYFNLLCHWLQQVDLIRHTSRSPMYTSSVSLVLDMNSFIKLLILDQYRLQYC